jgi:hypothetical protein
MDQITGIKTAVDQKSLTIWNPVILIHAGDLSHAGFEK